ncbi:MAG TPA: porphobilinogen synthase [Chloroflexota bacterium]|jgi:porphobilinogen synthase|nr:porphobilinogen synthase [Chloroflexota bacterium]
MTVQTRAQALVHRPRRLRRTATLRRLVAEARLAADDLVLPLFVDDEPSGHRPIGSMPGVSRWSVDRLPEIVEQVAERGVPGVLLFGVPGEKHEDGRGAWDPAGPVQRAVGRIKRSAPELVVMTDVCLCEYTTHGHCGLIDDHALCNPVNDASVELLVRQALSHAESGADVVAPSDMFDGRVGAIRRGLDERGFQDVAIVSYAAKYASAYYGPFREAAGSVPAFGDRRTHQMDPANAREALRELALDAEEGADVLMVKPALAYLDVLARARERFDLPLAAYNVSGEYAMVKAAAANGWIDERRVVTENLLAMRRAGADFVFTYHALEVCRWLGQ